MVPQGSRHAQVLPAASILRKRGCESIAEQSDSGRSSSGNRHLEGWKKVWDIRGNEHKTGLALTQVIGRLDRCASGVTYKRDLLFLLPKGLRGSSFVSVLPLAMHNTENKEPLRKHLGVCDQWGLYNNVLVMSLWWTITTYLHMKSHHPW